MKYLTLSKKVEKYEENKGENEDENGYLKTCYNLSKLYNNWVKNDLNNVDKFNKMEQLIILWICLKFSMIK